LRRIARNRERAGPPSHPGFAERSRRIARDRGRVGPPSHPGFAERSRYASRRVRAGEAQFLSAKVVDQLWSLTLAPGLPVICYGLRTDFQTHLFEGSRRLLELADSIEEVKVTCQYCNKKAVFNMRLVGGKPVREGEQIQIGGDESYVPVCHGCYVRSVDA
jgi:thymidine kinase